MQLKNYKRKKKILQLRKWMKKALITFWCLDGERRLTNEEDTRSIERLDFLLYIKENKETQP